MKPVTWDRGEQLLALRVLRPHYGMLMRASRALTAPPFLPARRLLCLHSAPHMPFPLRSLIQPLGAWLSLTCHQITHTKFTCIPRLSSCCRFATKNKSWSSWLSRSGTSAVSLIAGDREGSREDEWGIRGSVKKGGCTILETDLFWCQRWVSWWMKEGVLDSFCGVILSPNQGILLERSQNIHRLWWQMNRTRSDWSFHVQMH